VALWLAHGPLLPLRLAQRLLISIQKVSMESRRRSAGFFYAFGSSREWAQKVAAP
jgi:hypothetical protein